MTTTLLDVDDGEIERLARAIQAQLHPLTGERASGTALVTRTGGPVQLFPNTYAIPVNESGDRPTENKTMLVKVGFNPATVKPFNQAGEWDIGAGATPIGFVANAGGVRFNQLGPGWKLRFDPPIAGLAPTADVDTQWDGGVDGIVKATAIYEDVDEPRSIFDAAVGNFPAVVIGWLGEEAAEGRTAGVVQGATRKNRDTRAYHEEYGVYIIVTSALSGSVRRKEGARLVGAVRNCLSDHSMNDDGETLAAFGTGLEVMQSARAAAVPQAWVYVVRVRAATTVQRVDTRKWNKWRKLKLEASLPAQPDIIDGVPQPDHQPNELRLIAPKPDGTPTGILVDIPQDP